MSAPELPSTWALGQALGFGEGLFRRVMAEGDRATLLAPSGGSRWLPLPPTTFRGPLSELAAREAAAEQEAWQRRLAAACDVADAARALYAELVDERLSPAERADRIGRAVAMLGWQLEREERASSDNARIQAEAERRRAVVAAALEAHARDGTPIPESWGAQD